MEFQGTLRKMSTAPGRPLQYFLKLSNDLILVNQLFGKEIRIEHTGYCCTSCGDDRPIFRMGFCKKCFFESPYASETIIRPELSRAHLGIEERNLEVEQRIQLQPHVVYLSYTGDVKVGVTRKSNLPQRWIDQGATFATVIAETPNRYEAGVIEAELKKHISDTTSWKKMLSDVREEQPDFDDFKNKLKELWPDGSSVYAVSEAEIFALDYPYTAPDKVQALRLEKNPMIIGKLVGVKGQYLSFSGIGQMNVYAHEGFVVRLQIQ